MVAYTKPKQRKKEESERGIRSSLLILCWGISWYSGTKPQKGRERPRDEEDMIKFVDSRIEKREELQCACVSSMHVCLLVMLGETLWGGLYKAPT